MQARVVLQYLYSIVSMRTLTSVFFVFTTLWMQSAPRPYWLEPSDVVDAGWGAIQFCFRFPFRFRFRFRSLFRFLFRFHFPCCFRFCCYDFSDDVNSAG